MAAAQPRVAVVGGGIAGTLCSLVLKNRGIHPTLIDAGKNGVGGRLRNGGAQFLRAADPKLATVVGLLERQGLLSEWKGRFGMLGSSGGGFLPAEIVQRHAIQPPSQAPDEKKEEEFVAASDGGDFCHLVMDSNVPTYVGVPEMTDLCPNICKLANIEEINNASLVSCTPVEEGWTLDVQNNNNNVQMIDSDKQFDALVLATHDPSIASGAIRSIVDKEVDASGYTSTEEAMNNSQDDSSIVISRLLEISHSLQRVRDNDRMPVYAINITYPKDFSQDLPFDAVSIPGSQMVQFLKRDASLPGNDHDIEQWTAITTTRLASYILSQHLSDKEKISQVIGSVTNEIAQLLAKFHGGKTPPPLEVSAKRWGAAFCARGLELKEDSIFLAPWRLTVCGDFVRDLSAYATPLEAAALSGLEAGERTAAFWSQSEQ